MSDRKPKISERATDRPEDPELRKGLLRAAGLAKEGGGTNSSAAEDLGKTVRKANGCAADSRGSDHGSYLKHKKRSSARGSGIDSEVCDASGTRCTLGLRPTGLHQGWL